MDAPELPARNDGKAHPARIYNYLLGGKDHLPADRAAAEQALRAVPAVAAMARANRDFLARAVDVLAASGIGQFLDIGPGLPADGDVVQVARRRIPDARVAMADADPYVVAHLRALLPDPAGTAVVQGDVRDPEAILHHPDIRALIDFAKPVAVVMAAVLHFVPETEDAPGIVARLRGALADGSALVISHGTDGGQPERALAAAEAWKTATAQLTLRTPAQIRALFADLTILKPGVVGLPKWRPEGPLPADWETIWLHGGVGIVPRQD